MQKLLFSAMLFFGACRTPEPNELASDRLYSDQICCGEQRGDGVFYRTADCSNQNVRDCCRPRGVDRLVSSESKLVRFAPMACESLTEDFLSRVEICRGETRFANGQPGIGHVSDIGARILRLGHAWIKVGETEVGMGPTTHAAADPKSRLEAFTDFFTAEPLRQRLQVSWVDHRGFSKIDGAVCAPLYLCDESCVLAQLELGKSLGVYSIVNQCHVKAVEVLRNCGCYNHCVAKDPITGICLKRVFPELRGFKLNDSEGNEL